MLDSLYISNYRNLEELSIDSLGAVNLIIGKNNTGKSSLLEAVGIYATGADLDFIFQLLEERGENYNQGHHIHNPIEINKKALSNLFTGRKTYLFGEPIEIGPVHNNQLLDSKEIVSLNLIPVYDEETSTKTGKTISRTMLFSEEDLKKHPNYRFALQIGLGTSYFIASLDSLDFKNLSKRKSAIQFIRTRNIDSESNAKLWDDIILTEKENYVIDALKIIEPNVERIAFIEESFGGRSAVIKLKNDTSVLPLRSMGDGINRVLTIILALVNAVDGYLLIDEFENGLHHSVQEKLWEIIFTLSQKLNIQVFATTHSEDCIAGFEEVLNSHSDKSAGKLIRLENKNGKIVEVEFTAKELRIATENNIEIR